MKMPFEVHFDMARPVQTLCSPGPFWAPWSLCSVFRFVLS